MKILKDKQTSLLLKSFLLKNQDYLSVSILYYFDLDHPEVPLDEQAMYRELPKVLNKTLLDYAMPKLRAEVLLAGTCHNPLPQEGAAHVRLSVDTLEKELYVLGERRWQGGSITKPLPFKKMPLDYAHAVAVDDRLPNIEDPKAMTATKAPTKQPAGFMPLELFREENRKKLGTYDAAWKRDLWPGFAADMDYSFFNVAPEDQQFEQFFRGGEQIRLENMHPEKRMLLSTVPQSSFRCFVTRDEKDDEERFEELKLQRDTLWLFPEIARGVVIFRGTVAIQDEIYSDLKYLNIKPIDPSAPHLSLDDYHTLQKKELSRSVQAASPSMEEHHKAVAEAKKEIFEIPRMTKEQLEKSSGKRPILHRTPSEKLSRAHKNIDKTLEHIERSKARLQQMKTSSGHITKIDLAPLDETKEKLLASKALLADAASKIETLHQAHGEMKEEVLSDLEALKKDPNIPDEMKEKLKYDFLEPKEKVWSDHAMDFVSSCVKHLEHSAEQLHQLRHLGLSERTIRRAWIGHNDTPQKLNAASWALQSEETLQLPQGLVTVRFKEATVKALRIDNEVILGSDTDYPLFLTQGDLELPLFYFKDDDLQAHLCDQETYDICNTLCCADISAVGKEEKTALKKASTLFYLQEDGVIEKLPQAKKFDCGDFKDLFEMHQNGIDIREQFIENLSDEEQATLPLERDISPAAIQNQVKELMAAERAAFTAKTERLKEEVLSERDAALKQANETLKKYGLDTLDTSATAAAANDDSITVSDVTKKFDTVIDHLQKKSNPDGSLLDEMIAKLQEGKATMIAMVEKAETQFQAGKEKIGQVEEMAKDPIPDWAKKMMLNAGIDPDHPFEEPLTREDVIRLHAQGDSLAKKDLSGLDLSGLALQGIDLTQANLTKTNFTESDISGAKLNGANCSESIFTKTDLSSANADQALFNKALFQESRCQAMRAEKASFNATVFKNARCDNALFQSASFQESTLEKSHFENVDLSKSSFHKAVLTESCFDSAEMSKATFSESTLNGCSLQSLHAKALLFNKSSAEQCDFSDSDLYNMRLLKASALYNCDFTTARLQKSTFFEAVVERCDFKSAHMDNALIKKSELRRCDFRGVSAKKSRFEYAHCSDSKFGGIDLLKGSLRRMELSNCDFSYANLYGVEFYKARLYNVRFDNANLRRSGLENRVELIDD